jgi:hypothetical protein
MLARQSSSFQQGVMMRAPEREVGGIARVIDDGCLLEV